MLTIGVSSKSPCRKEESRKRGEKEILNYLIQEDGLASDSCRIHPALDSWTG